MMRGLPLPQESNLSGDVVNTLRSRLAQAERELSELTAELARTQEDYRQRDAELAALKETHRALLEELRQPPSG